MFPSEENRPDLYALPTEMEVLFDNCVDTKSMTEIISKACELRVVLKLAFRLVRLVITAGFCVSTNERKFSQLKIVKNVLRSTMGDERLDSLMLLTSEKDLTDAVDLSLVVDSLARLKERRIRVQLLSKQTD
jgi:hypothetical protein